MTRTRKVVEKPAIDQKEAKRDKEADDSDVPEDHAEIEKILRVRIKDGKKEYRVKWMPIAGEKNQPDSWRSKEEMRADRLLREFEDTFAKMKLDEKKKQGQPAQPVKKAAAKKQPTVAAKKAVEEPSEESDAASASDEDVAENQQEPPAKPTKKVAAKKQYKVAAKAKKVVGEPSEESDAASDEDVAENQQEPPAKKADAKKQPAVVPKEVEDEPPGEPDTSSDDEEEDMGSENEEDMGSDEHEEDMGSDEHEESAVIVAKGKQLRAK